MRLSIKKHNQVYLEYLASQMGITDISEVLNYLLLDIKGLGYQFGNKPAPQPQPQAPLGFDASTFEPFQPAFAPNHDGDRNHIDPMIQRLIDAGLEMDF
ncbi:hypothetical protein [Tolypothrix sp. VBCCA 56010]|uniref:hypothetical protein n=1 Tax=Tolypothrix sp. VBCCA 56010 TaxID=3137731 RepID=UPI003D7D59D0